MSDVGSMHRHFPLRWVAFLSLCFAINTALLPFLFSLLPPLSRPSFCYSCVVEDFSFSFPAAMKFGWFEAAALTAASVVSAQV